MSSIKERMDAVQMITINHDEEFCLKIMKGKIEIGKILIGLKSATRDLASDKCNIDIWTLNPNTMDNKILLTEYIDD